MLVVLQTPSTHLVNGCPKTWGDPAGCHNWHVESCLARMSSVVRVVSSVMSAESPACEMLSNFR
eukprot:2382358-Prorocentrum_lima.AAC.1